MPRQKSIRSGSASAQALLGPRGQAAIHSLLLAAVAWIISPTDGLAAAVIDVTPGHTCAGGGRVGASRFHVFSSIGQALATPLEITSPRWASRAGFGAQINRWLNAAPVAAPDILETRPGQGGHILAATLLGNDRDGDWDDLVLVSVDTTSVGGALIRRDGPWLVYLPVASSPESDSFSYRVEDGHGGGAVGTVLLRLAGPPNPSASPLAIRVVSSLPRQVEVRFAGIPGRSYRLGISDHAEGPWTTPRTITADALGQILYHETIGEGPRFYRITE